MRFIILILLIASISAADAPQVLGIPEIDDAAAAIEKNLAEQKTLRADYAAKVSAFIKGLDTKPVAVPELGADPRQSERDAADKAKRFNGMMLYMTGRADDYYFYASGNGAYGNAFTFLMTYKTAKGGFGVDKYKPLKADPTPDKK